MPSRTGTHVVRVALAIVSVVVWSAPSQGGADSTIHTLACSPERTIGAAIKILKPGDTLLVSGVCNENVALGQ